MTQHRPHGEETKINFAFNIEKMKTFLHKKAECRHAATSFQPTEKITPQTGMGRNFVNVALDAFSVRVVPRDPDETPTPDQGGTTPSPSHPPPMKSRRDFGSIISAAELLTLLPAMNRHQQVSHLLRSVSDVDVQLVSYLFAKRTDPVISSVVLLSTLQTSAPHLPSALFLEAFLLIKTVARTVFVAMMASVADPRSVVKYIRFVGACMESSAACVVFPTESHALLRYLMVLDVSRGLVEDLSHALKALPANGKLWIEVLALMPQDSDLYLILSQ